MYTKQQLVVYVNEKTGLDREAILFLISLTTDVRFYLSSQLLLLIRRLRSEKSRALFNAAKGSVSVSRIESSLAGIDTAIEAIDRVYTMTPFGSSFPARIPWSDLAERSESFSNLMDIMRTYMNKISDVNIGSFTIPGLSGVNSIHDLHRRRDDLSWRLQQITNMKTYAGIISSKIDNSIYEVETWINSMDLINANYQTAYTFTGYVYVSSDFYTVYWTDGVLTIDNTTYTIESGFIDEIAVGDTYLYFDVDSALNGFLDTSGALLSKSGNNTRIGKVTISGYSIPVLTVYGSIGYTES